MNTTRTEITAEVNNFYNRTLLERALPFLAHNMFAQVKDIPANSGSSTAKFRRYGALAANTTALSEGVTPSGKQLSVTDITVNVSQYGDYVTITDKVDYESIDPVLTEAAEVLGEQAGESLDQIVRDIMVAGDTVQYASSATSRGTVTSAMVLDRAEILEGVMTLDVNNARRITSLVDASTGFNTKPLNPSYVGIVHPRAVKNLKDATGWTPVSDYADKSDLMPGEIGALDDVRFIQTTAAKVFSAAGSGGIDVYATLLMGRDAYAVTRISGQVLINIVKPLGSAGAADPLNQRQTSGWKATLGALILNQSWILRIEHAVN